MTPTTRTRLVLVAIFVLFLVPLVAAVLLQPEQFGDDPVDTVNRGDLVQPPVRLMLEGVALTDGRPVLEETRGRWTLLHVIGAGCDARCESVVTDLRQVHLATGRHQGDVSLLLVGENLQPARLLDIYGRFLVLESPDARLLSSLASAAGPNTGTTPALDARRLRGTTFIVDPEGNLMLRYAPGYARGDLNKDLGKLLKWSGR